MNRTGLGLAIGAGYVLGRTKKMKLAFAVGSLVAGKKMNLTPKGIAELVSQQLQNNPQFKEIGDQLRQDLRGVGKAASGAMVERQMNALADRLHGRTDQVRDQLEGVVPGESESEDDEEPEEATAEDENAEEDLPEEDEEPRAEEDEEDEEDDEDEEEPEPPRKEAARKTARKAPAQKAPAKKAPSKKTAASKAPAKKTAAKKSAAKKTAGRKTASAGGARRAGGRLPKGGGDR
ncbi:DNA primase [Streptomyces sp. NBC_00076]|uniref:DNA primase n=1 Tax=Streptomyces sp. NBC_00076 TaxID=2975642 RepID=UPI003247DADF